MLARRHSQEHKMPHEHELQENHNKTTMFIHEDNTVLRVLADGSVKPEEEILEEEHSMFVSATRSRRQSEPTLGSHLLKQLQEKALSDLSLSESIKNNLPSDMVAEEDEEEEQIETEKEGQSKNILGFSNLNINDSDVTKKSAPNTDNADSNNNRDNGKKLTKFAPETIKATSKDKPNLKNRRKSEGDVLKFTKVFRMKAQAAAEKRRSSKTEEEPQLPVNDELWDAVRHCRYIRGYEPPEVEMVGREDISDFVFGHKSPAS